MCYKKLPTAPSAKNLPKSSIRIFLGAIHKGRPADPGEGGLRNLDVQLSFECDSIVLYGRRGRGGSRNPGFSRAFFVNGPLDI